MSQFLFSHFVSELPIYINISKLRQCSQLGTEFVCLYFEKYELIKIKAILR